MRNASAYDTGETREVEVSISNEYPADYPATTPGTLSYAIPANRDISQTNEQYSQRNQEKEPSKERHSFILGGRSSPEEPEPLDPATIDKNFEKIL